MNAFLFKTDKKKNHNKKLLAKKILSAVTAIGYAVNPLVGYAQNITASNNSGTVVEQGKNGVTNIWAGKVVGDTAVNIFDQFQLDQNNIANMYFKQQGSNTWQNNLVNFVNGHVDINGTINAIKDNKIGGNLFFLSKDGIAVGKNGVINAGALTMMTPTADFYNKIISADDHSFNQENFVSQWSNIQKAQIPINTQGTITVDGKINTVNGINMKAGTININKTGVLKNLPSVDFADLVNIQGDENISSGLAGDLQAVADENSGDIILTAVAENNDGNNNIAKVTVDSTVSTHQDIAISAQANNTLAQNNEAEVSITGNIAANHVNIEANATNTQNDTYNQITNKANIEIANNAVIQANAQTVADENALSINASAKLNVSNSAGQNAVGQVNIDNSANVNINGAIKANGNTDISSTTDTTLSINNKNISIVKGNSESSVVIGSSAQMNGVNDSKINGDLKINANNTNSIENKASSTTDIKGIAITDYDSNANVDINSDIKAQNVDVSANNTTEKNITNTDQSTSSVNGNLSKAEYTQIIEQIKQNLGNNISDQEILSRLNLALEKGQAINLVNEQNNANVIIGSNVNVQADEQLSIQAKTLQKQNSFSSTGINVSNNDTNSLIMLGKGSNLTAGKIDIAAQNDINTTVTTQGSDNQSSSSIVTGNSNTVVVIDNTANIKANATNASDGSLNIKTDNNANINNTASNSGDSLAQTKYETNTIVAIGDIDENSTDATMQKAVNIIKNNLQLANKDLLNIVGTATEQGSIKVDSMSIEAITSGNITTTSDGGNASDTGLNSIAKNNLDDETDNLLSDEKVGSLAINDVDNNTSVAITNANIELNKTDSDNDINIKTQDALNVNISSKADNQAVIALNKINSNTSTTISDSAIDNVESLSSVTTKDGKINATVQNESSQNTPNRSQSGTLISENVFDNNVTNSILGSDITAVNVELNAMNSSNISAQSNVTTSSNGIIQNVIAKNKGTNDNKVIIDKSANTNKQSTISNINNLLATSTNNTDITASAGNDSTINNLSLGNIIASNEIGNGVDDKQQNTVEINNTNITTTNDTANISLTAEDNSSISTVSEAKQVLNNGINIQAIEATTVVNKDNIASMNNTNINKNTNNTSATVDIQANNTSNVNSSASIMGNSTVASGGAAISTNKINQSNKALLNGGSLNIGDLNLKAIGNAQITNTASGVSASNMVAGSQSLTTNEIDSDVISSIAGGASITADNNVGVIAQSDDTITNITGQTSDSGIIAGGVSTSVNIVSGDTVANIGDEDTKTSVVAKGNNDNDKLITNGNIDDSALNDSLVNDYNHDASINRNETQHSGIVVEASATHNIKSTVINNASSTGSGMAGNFNVNSIAGNTTATVNNAILNNDANCSDVSIKANDYTNITNFVGGLGTANTGIGMGTAYDEQSIDRNTYTTVKNSTIYAKDLSAESVSKQGISSLITSVAATDIGAGLSGIMATTELNSKTATNILDSDIKAENIDIDAEHSASISIGNISVAGTLWGASVGSAIGILKDNSDTQVNISSDKEAKNSIEATGKINVNAKNTTKATTTLSSTGVAAFAGLSGATAINNINGLVKTNIDNMKITSTNGTVEVNAENNLDLDSYLGANAGGSAGVGTSVSINTIDNIVQNNIKNSEINAKEDINISTKEDRAIKQLVTNATAGIVGAGANIAITNIGKKIENSDIENLENQINQANNKFDIGNYVGDNVDKEQLPDNINADLGGKNQVDTSTASQTTTNITGSTLSAGDQLQAEATEQNNIDMTSGSGTLGAVAVNAGVGLLNIAHNVGINFANNIVTADTMNVGANVTGVTNVNSYQGSVGVVSGNAAYSKVDISGINSIDFDSVDFKGNNVNLSTNDDSTTNNNVLGITAGVASVGAIVAETNTSNNTQINISNSNIDSEKQANIGIEKENEINSHATGGIGGILSGNSVVANAQDSGNATINIGKNNVLSSSKLNLNANVKPAVSAIADSYTVSIAGSAGASVATAKTAGTVNIILDDDNTLSSDNININANVSAKDGKDTTTAKVEGNTGSAFVSVSGNTATATTDMKVNVDIGKVKYKTKSEEVISGYHWDEQGNKIADTSIITTGLSNLKINATNTTSTVADARGITIGGIVSKGNNTAITNNTSSTNVNLKGQTGTDKTLVNSLYVNAAGTTNTTTTANGDGGGILSGGLAADTQNTTDSNTTLDVTGNWSSVDDVDISAMQSDNINMNSNAIKAALIGASGTRVSNTVKGATTVNLEDAQLTSSGDLNTSATNNITFNDKYQYAVEGSGYGGIAVQGTELINNIDKTANIDLKNATIYSAGAQTHAVKTVANINANGSVKAGGLGSDTMVDIDNTLNINNGINIDENSSLKTTGINKNITLASSDDTTLTIDAVANTQAGAAGGASAKAENNLTRNNKINIAGHLYSMQDANIYAGKDAQGAEGNLKLSITAEAYNKAMISVATPEYINNYTQNNQINIKPNARIDSVRNIDLYADSGDQAIDQNSYMYTWYNSSHDGGYTSSSAGNGDSNIAGANNFVQVDGTLTAGVQNKQNITIGGDGQIVFLDKNTADAVNKAGQQEAVTESGIIIEGSDNIKNNIEFGTMDYGTELFNRYNELNELITSYSQDKESAAYLGYVAERERLLDQMISYGLIEETTDAQGNPCLKTVEGMTVDYISLPDIVASGGNIKIQTDNVKGDGQMTAQGAPEINIVNNTNLYLKVNNVVIGDLGGEIIYNNQSIKNNAQINDINSSVKNNNLGIKIDDTKQTTPEINIKGNYSGSTIYAKVTDDKGNEQLISTVPIADIEINGVVSNSLGNVNIESAHDSIVIQGKDATSSAGVTGKTVSLVATSGSVSQGYTDGIVNIGGSVQDIYENQYNNFKNDVNHSHDFKENGYEQQTGSVIQAQGNMIAGENIYINASDINVNGYMQSGYGKYDLTIDESIQAKIDSIKKNWADSGSANLSDAVVTTGDAYKIVVGANVWDEASQSYVKVVDAYYNPSTGKIIVPDVDAHGGQIHLTGRISSTGGGTIKVLDGAYDINVDNKTNNDIQLGKLVSNNVEGLISITDTAKNTITEMKRGNTVVKVYDKDSNQWVVSSDTNETATEYKPEEGLRYNWTTGQDTTSKQHYQKEITKGFWGLLGGITSEDMNEVEQSTPSKPVDGSGVSKPNGEFVGSVDNINSNEDVIFIFDNTVLNDHRSDVTEKHYSTGFLGWNKHTIYNWDRETGSSQQYVASVKADKNINIGFFGNQDGNSTINVSSVGNIDLNNNITSSGNKSTVNITSQNGYINQNNGTISASEVKLNANSGITNIDITAKTDNDSSVKLNAINKGTGSVGITVNGSGVDINKVTTGSGNVSLTSDGDIKQIGTDVSVKGDRIDLTSLYGGIGTKDQAIIVDAGQSVVNSSDSLSASLNAGAKNSIYLTQADGDMRLGRVYSDQGDVTLTVVNGNLVDALPEGESANSTDTDELIQKWKDLGLIDNGDDYTQSEIEAINQYKESVRDEFDQYTSQKDYYDKNSANVSQAYKDAYNKYTTAKDSYDKNVSDYNTFKDLSAYYNDDSNIPRRDGYRDEAAYNQALTEYNKGKADFEATKGNFTGYKTADAYAAAQMGTDAYNNYKNPTVDGKNLKGDFDSYSNYVELKNRYGAYDSADSYLNSDEAKAHIAGLKDPSAGWTQNDLLYAISDSIINPSSDAGDTIIKDPNIKGTNITLNVQNGNVGLNSEHVTTIDLNTLNTNEEALKQLANADASNVVWDSANGKAYIHEKTPIGIQMNNGGKLNVTANDNVYLSGRTVNNDSSIANIINIEHISTNGDIRIQGKNGIYNVSDGNTATIKGNDLLIQAGVGSIGNSDKFMTVDLTGKLQAQAQDNIYLEQISADNTDHDMKIVSIGAGKDIVLKSDNDIVSADSYFEDADDSDDENATDTTTAVGYIRSDNGDITIEAKGNIGTTENRLNIKNVKEGNTEQIVNLNAGKNIYINGISTSTAASQPAEGVLNIADVKANGNINIAVNGTANIFGELVNNTEDSSAYIQVTAEKNINVNDDVINKKGDVILSAKHDLNLNKGQLIANRANIVASAVRATNQNIGAGKITQSQEHSIIANNLVALANNGIDLSNKNNDLQNVDLWNLSEGDINLASNGNHSLSVVIEKRNDGIINIHQYKTADKDNDVYVNSEVEANDIVNIVNDAGDIITAKTDKVATYYNGNIDNHLAVSGTDVNISSAGKVYNTKNIETSDANVIIYAGDDIINNGSINSTGTVTITSESGDVTNNQDIISSGTTVIKADGDIQANGAITSTGAVEITSDNGNININDRINTAQKEDKSVDSNNKAEDITVVAQNGSINIEDLLNGKDITLIADDDIISKGDVYASGDVAVNTTQGNIGIAGVVDASNSLTNGNVTATADNGNITIANDVIGDNVTIKANGNINANGDVQASGNVTATADEGDIAISDNVTGNDVNMQAGGNIDANGYIEASGDINATAVDGDISFKGVVNATDEIENGNITATAQHGKITVDNGLNGKDINLTAKEDIVENGSIQSTGNVNFASDTGDVSIQGDIYVTQSQKDDEGNINATTNTGNISVNEALSANNIKLIAGNNITVNNTITADNDVYIESTKSGDITNQIGNFVQANNIDIKNSGEGNINFTDIKAKETANVFANSGNITLGTIDGNHISVVLNNEEKQMDIQDILPGLEVTLIGNHIYVGEITQHLDEPRMLDMIIQENVRGDKAITNLDIDNITTNNAVRFKHLWVKDANIHVNKGETYFDKIYVEHKAYLSTNNMDTSVYGGPPIYDDSNSIYWNNTNINHPDDDLANWLSDDNPGNKWTYINFTSQGNKQISNGILLHLDNYYYVYNQRFTAENLAKYLDDTKALNIYNNYYKPNISYFNRYDLYAYTDKQAQQSAMDKIIVDM